MFLIAHTERNQMKRRTVFIAIALIAGLASPIQAHEVESPQLVFPIVGDVEYTDTFGAPRDGGARSHEGTDIMTNGVKGLPVVAAADGVVSWVDDDCCHLAIDHGDGWSTWYIHLNNDTPGTDDGLGWGIAEGITDGTQVVAGQLIGWVGDSGNAEWVAPQLHFETRYNGSAVNPYPALVSAPTLAAPGETELQPPDWFTDDDGSVHETNINKLYELEITRGCTTTEFCPDGNVTRGELAAFLRRYLDLPASDGDHFTDDTGSVFEGDINALTSAGIGFGCTDTLFCPDEPIRRSEMAEFLVRTYAPADPSRYENLEALDYFTDDDGDQFESSIDQLRHAQVTVGCNPPDGDQFCPDQPLTRAQMATFIIRAIDPVG
jgi:murein DD-endopeptidase MepM/ murein hydrolase activator NlpD